MRRLFLGKTLSFIAMATVPAFLLLPEGFGKGDPLILLCLSLGVLAMLAGWVLALIDAIQSRKSRSMLLSLVFFNIPASWIYWFRSRNKEW